MHITASDRSALIHLASTLPKGSEERRAILAGLSKNSTRKEASDDFASYILNTTGGNPIPVGEVEAFIKGIGAPVYTGGAKRMKPRFREGKRYCIKAEKHTGKFPEPVLADGTPTTYRSLDRKFGVVIDDGGGVKGGDLTMKMKNGKVVTFPQVQEQYRNVGIGAATDYSKMKGYGPIEIIYKADPSREPPAEQKQIAAEYIERGEAKGQKRSLNYYSGFVLHGANGRNGFYFRVMAQQRLSGDPCDETYGIRGFNPTDGQVLYIGIRGRGRPRGWEIEWAEMKEAAMLAAK